MLERIPVSYFFPKRSSWAFVSRNGGQRGTLSGRKFEREGSSSQPSSAATRTAVRRRTSAYSS
jgi:hypothetical protein